MVCISCGEAYHIGCLNSEKLNNIKHVKSNLILCCPDNYDDVKDLTVKHKIEYLTQENDKLKKNYSYVIDR